MHDVGQLVQAQHRSKAPSEKVKRAEFLIIAIDIQWDSDFDCEHGLDYEWHLKADQPNHSKFNQMAAILFLFSSIFK